jgi:hypothetical protein
MGLSSPGSSSLIVPASQVLFSVFLPKDARKYVLLTAKVSVPRRLSKLLGERCQDGQGDGNMATGKAPKPRRFPKVARWPPCLDSPTALGSANVWRADERRQTPWLKKRGKLANSIFFRTQPPLPCALTAPTEFANRGKLSWQTGKLNDRLGRTGAQRRTKESERFQQSLSWRADDRY